MLETARSFLAALLMLFKPRSEFQAEILVLRHRLNVLRRKAKGRPRLTSWDRLLFVGLIGPITALAFRTAVETPDRFAKSRPWGPTLA